MINIDLSTKVGYRLFLEKIFFGIKDIIVYEKNLICFSSEGVSIWILYNKNLIFEAFYDKKSKEYMRIKKIIYNEKVEVKE